MTLEQGVICLDRLTEQGLTSHQTHYRSYRGRIFTETWWKKSISLVTQEHIEAYRKRPWWPAGRSLDGWSAIFSAVEMGVGEEGSGLRSANSHSNDSVTMTAQ